jgi:hypothetical protein
MGATGAMATYWVIATVAMAAFPFATYAISEVGIGAVLAAFISALATRLLAPRTAAIPSVCNWARPALMRGALAVVVVLFLLLTVLLLAAWFVSWGELPKTWITTGLP